MNQPETLSSTHWQEKMKRVPMRVVGFERARRRRVSLLGGVLVLSFAKTKQASRAQMGRRKKRDQELR